MKKLPFRLIAILFAIIISTTMVYQTAVSKCEMGNFTIFQETNLNGIWKSDSGGTYYIRQIGNEVWWYGEENPTAPGWSNVAKGKIEGYTLKLDWADVPKGGIISSGKLVIKIESNSKLIRTSETGGFGDSEWNK